MKWTVFVAALAAAFSAFSTEPVVANDVADVVRARANARAGGGTSGHDAWVLQRHGKLSGSGSSSRRALAKKKAAKKRAYLLAKKKKAAAVKRRALIAAKKKKAAERRAYLLAKKKKEAEKRARLAAKKKKEKLAAQQKTEQQKIAVVTPEQEQVRQGDGQTEKTEGTFVTVPSTSALITSQEIAPATTEQLPTAPPADFAGVKPNTETDNENVVDAKDQTVTGKTETGDSNCQRFLPAIGLTISVGC